MKAQVILFTRVPRFGCGKRRLAAEWGELRAWQFQRQQVGRLLRVLGQRGACWDLWSAITPAQARFRPGGSPAMPRAFGQRGDDLGARMIHALRWVSQQQRRGTPVLLIGSDLPGLGAGQIARAVAALRWHDLVYGPAEDGGFWLVGWSGRRPLAALGGLFAGVAWSHAGTLAQALAAQSWVAQRGRLGLGDLLADVDDLGPSR